MLYPPCARLSINIDFIYIDLNKLIIHESIFGTEKSKEGIEKLIRTSYLEYICII